MILKGLLEYLFTANSLHFEIEPNDRGLQRFSQKFGSLTKLTLKDFWPPDSPDLDTLD